MADGLLPINFVVNEKYLAFSETNPRKILIPSFNQEDILQIKFKALKRISESFPFLEKLNLTGYALQISIGNVGSILANNITWNLTENGTALEGELNLNTAPLLAALTADSVNLIFEIILSTASVKYRMSQVVAVKKSVVLTGALVPPPTDTALGKLEATRLYVPLADCPGFVMKDEVTSQRCFVHLVNGALLADPI